jgi:hypothetical protein
VIRFYLSLATLIAMIFATSYIPAQSTTGSTDQNKANINDVLTQLNKIGIDNIASVRLDAGFWQIGLIRQGQIEMISVNPTTFEIVSPGAEQIIRQSQASDAEAKLPSTQAESVDWLENLEYTQGQIKLGPNNQAESPTRKTFVP